MHVCFEPHDLVATSVISIFSLGNGVLIFFLLLLICIFMIGFFYMSVRLLYVDYDHYLRFHMSCIHVLTEKKGGTEHNLRF